MPKKLLTAGFFAFIFLLFLHPINSGDFFHHLNTGRYIVQHLALPYTDDLSFTAYGLPWVAHSWGAGLIFYLLYSAFGPPGITIFLALCGVLSSIFLYKILRSLKIELFPAMLLTLLGASLISLRWPTRPEVLGPTFLIGLIYLLTKYKTIRLFLPLFFWLWGIIYGSSTFLGIGVFLLFLLVNKYFNRRDLIVFVISIITSLLNGYGLKSFLYIFQIPSIAGYVGEWLPLHKTLNHDAPDLVLFYQTIVLCYLLFTLLYLTLLLAIFLKKRSLLKKHLFFFIISLSIFAPFYTNRFINLAPLLVLPFFALMLPHTKYLRKIVFGYILLVVIIAAYTRFSLYPLGVGVQESPFQPSVISYLKENNIDGNIYSSQEIGAFLSTNLPSSKIFLDTRDDLYIPTGIFKELQDAQTGRIPLALLLDKYKTNIVVGDIGGNQFYKPLFYNPDWKLVFLTDGYFISVRTELANQHNLTALDALDPSKMPPSKPGQLENAASELRALLTQNPGSEENRVRLIELLLAQNKFNEAKSELERTDLTGFYGARQPVIDMDSEILKTRVFLANTDCTKSLASLQKAESLRYHKFIFYPSKQIPSTVDEYWGDYYGSCKNDPNKAAEYYSKFIQTVGTPLDRFRVERKLQRLR